MYVHHAAFFICMFALLHAFLTTRVIGRRRAKLIAYGNGNDEKMIRIQSAQANLLENAMYMSLLLIVAELMLSAAGKRFGWILFILSSMFLVGRVFHIHGMIKFNLKTRKIGMHLTIWPLLATVFYTLYLSVAPLLF